MGSVACCYPEGWVCSGIYSIQRTDGHGDENLRMRMKAGLPDTIAGAWGHLALRRKDAETYGASIAVLPFWMAMWYPKQSNFKTEVNGKSRIRQRKTLY